MERAEPGFDRRCTAVIAPGAFEGTWQLARSPGEWHHDLSVRYRREERAEAEALHLFAGLRVRDFTAARPWYERLFGEPSFFPHETEAVWTLAADRSVYVVEHPDGAGHGVVTVFVDDLDGRIAAVGARGIEPAECETLGNGVRRTTYRDPDGNEVVFAGRRWLDRRIAAVPFTLRNLREDLADVGSNFDGSPDLEFRPASRALELEHSGLSYQRIPPDYRFPYGHTHREQEEVFVVVGGSGRMKLDDEIVEVKQWDVVRVPPGTWRGYEAGSRRPRAPRLRRAQPRREPAGRRGGSAGLVG